VAADHRLAEPAAGRDYPMPRSGVVDRALPGVWLVADRLEQDRRNAAGASIRDARISASRSAVSIRTRPERSPLGLLIGRMRARIQRRICDSLTLA
jgi:hypothetical protein